MNYLKNNSDDFIKEREKIKKCTKIFLYCKNIDGRYFLDLKEDNCESDSDMANVEILYDNNKLSTFRVFDQNAMNYGQYSNYIRSHGCAACSLSTILSYFIDEYKNISPEDCVEKFEKKYFDEDIRMRNYNKTPNRQMPISFFGISKILRCEGISNEYMAGINPKKTRKDILDNLLRCRPVLIEVSRVRKKLGIPVSINDRKFAGSYHTLVLLGINQKREIIFADSANRKWSGKMQRIKKANIDEIMNYMFPRLLLNDNSLYFNGRWSSGGYILIK